MFPNRNHRRSLHGIVAVLATVLAGAWGAGLRADPPAGNADKKEETLLLKLPAALQKGTEPGEILLLDVNQDSDLVVPGRKKPLSTMKEKQDYLKERSAAYEKAEVGKTARITAVIRADENADYGKVYEIMTICKELGFKKLQLHARQKVK